MKTCFSVRVPVLLVLASAVLQSFADSRYEPYHFTTLTPLSGVGSADGGGRAARFNSPSGVAVDVAGNIYVADRFNNAVRKVTPLGLVTTLAGCASCGAGSADGIGRAARFRWPSDVALDQLGNVYVADTQNHLIRKVTPAGAVTTIAGRPGVAGYSDGPGMEALLNGPTSVAVDSAGAVYVADGISMIRKLAPANDGWLVTTFAGRPVGVGPTDGIGTNAMFNSPSSIAVDGANNLYVTDVNGIRRITPAAAVTTLSDFHATDVTVGAAGDELYLAVGSYVSKATFTGADWSFVKLAGVEGSEGAADGIGSAARFRNATGLALDAARNLFVADARNNNIRKVSTQGAVTTLAGLTSYGAADGLETTAQFDRVSAMALDAEGNLYLAESGGKTVRRLARVGTNWVVSTLAGMPGVAGSVDGIGTDARFVNPRGIAVARQGDVYVTDAGRTIRKLTRSGTDWLVRTVAGSASEGALVDGQGSGARFLYSSGIAVDQTGNIYVTDQSSIRKVSPSGVVTPFAGLAGSGGNRDGTGTAARFASPVGLALDSGGTLYVTDDVNSNVRKVTPQGEVTLLAGSIAYPGSTGNQDAVGTAARFFVPWGIAVDDAGIVYVAERANRVIRKITPAGQVTTITPQLGQNLLVTEGLTSMVVSSDGEIYLADLWNQIRAGKPAASITFGPSIRARDGVFGFEIIGPPGQTFVIEASTSLRAWAPVWTNTLDGPTSFPDAQTGISSQRFYRITTP